MRHIVIAAALLTGLAACQSGPRAPGGEMFMSDAEIGAKDDAQCRSFGAVPGSQAYFSCRMTMNQNRQVAANNLQRYQAQNLRSATMLLR